MNANKTKVMTTETQPPTFLSDLCKTHRMKDDDDDDNNDDDDDDDDDDDK